MDEIQHYILAYQRVSRGADQSLLGIPGKKYYPQEPHGLERYRNAPIDASREAFFNARQSGPSMAHQSRPTAAWPRGSYKGCNAQSEQAARNVKDEMRGSPIDDHHVVRSSLGQSRVAYQLLASAYHDLTPVQPSFRNQALATQAEVEALDDQLLGQIAPCCSADLTAELASQQLTAEKLVLEKSMLYAAGERQNAVLCTTQEENRVLRDENAQLLADLEQAYYMVSELSARAQKAGIYYSSAAASVMESATIEALQSQVAAYYYYVVVLERERESTAESSRYRVADAIRALDREKEEFIAQYRSLANARSECRDCAAHRERIRQLELELAARDAQICVYEELLQQCATGAGSGIWERQSADLYRNREQVLGNHYQDAQKDTGFTQYVLALIDRRKARQEALQLMAQRQFGFLCLQNGEIWRFLDDSGPCSPELHFRDRYMALGAGTPYGLLCCIQTSEELDFVDLSEMQLSHVFLSMHAFQIDLTGNDLRVADVSRCGRCTVSIEKTQKAAILPSPECVIACV